MRNVDQIKMLKKELGRYRKKVADQAEVEKRLRGLLDDAVNGTIQTNRAVDAILAQVAITYGEEAKDEETGVSIGRRIALPFLQVDDVLGKYEVRARRDDETDQYIIGVVPRETPNDPT